MMLLQNEKRVSEPVLPQKRKAPAQFEVGSSVGDHPNTFKDHYRRHYFQFLDLINPWRAYAARAWSLCVSVTQHLTFHVITRVKNDNNLLSGG